MEISNGLFAEENAAGTTGLPRFTGQPNDRYGVMARPERL
jgi:hypothetical protein